MVHPSGTRVTGNPPGRPPSRTAPGTAGPGGARWNRRVLKKNPNGTITTVSSACAAWKLETSRWMRSIARRGGLAPVAGPTPRRRSASPASRASATACSSEPGSMPAWASASPRLTSGVSTRSWPPKTRSEMGAGGKLPSTTACSLGNPSRTQAIARQPGRGRGSRDPWRPCSLGRGGVGDPAVVATWSRRGTHQNYLFILL